MGRVVGEVVGGSVSVDVSGVAGEVVDRVVGMFF